MDIARQQGNTGGDGAGILFYRPRHQAFFDQGQAAVDPVHTEYRDPDLTVSRIVTLLLQGPDTAFRHIVVVADDQLDHLAVGFRIQLQICTHIFFRGLCRPGAVQIQLIAVTVIRIKIDQFLALFLRQDLIGVLYRGGRTQDRVLVLGLALEHGVGNDIIVIQVHFIIVVRHITADHLPLQMSRFRRI